MICAAIFIISTTIADVGALPVNADGRPLNLDFETGDLRDWTADGDAFKQQPVEGDTVSKRRRDMKSGHQGKFWIGGWERFRDPPTGSLTSVPFKVTHPWASFLVGGGPNPTTRVEIVFKESNWVLHHFSGLAEEDMRRVAVDLRPQMGKEICIRLVDQHTGHWGHINFDDFRFHSTQPDVPARPAPKEPPDDPIAHAGLPPEQAARVMTVPEQFEVKLFAGEPDVKQPIAFCIDDRGRLWVAEAYTYPRRAPEGQGKDRILIFEDADGDGKFDKRTVFMEGLNLVSAIEIGFGGVWVGAAPYLMFVPWDETQTKPAGPPKILLDGWAWQDTHETLNTFTWGPDGWLYGCHGVFTHSRVGKPGTPDKDRIPINAGIWRYHPTRHEFEIFAHGTSNPWGIDFDENGQLFAEACVIPHCYHIVQGGRYERQAGSHFNPHTYDDIKTIADHLHYVGATPHGGNNRSDAAGGGHAHCGLMCYQGGAWPKEYWGKLFMGNIHGRRINMDVLKPKGSGFVASHGPDFLKANDAWARFINFKCGPDGNVFMIDWYDKQACHHNDPNIWDRTNGRIYKICCRGTKAITADLTAMSDNDLIKLTNHQNEWFVRHSRRLLQERQAKPSLSATSPLAVGQSPAIRLKVMLMRHCSGAAPRSELLARTHEDDAIVRGWAIQLALDDRYVDDGLLARLKQLAADDPSAIVRLYISSGLQRIPRDYRWDILKGLLSHAEDAADPNLPFMYWYAAEPLADEDPARALALAREGKIPHVYSFMARRLASKASANAIDEVLLALHKSDNDAERLLLLDALKLGLKGRRNLKVPPSRMDVFARLQKSENADIRERATAVALVFNDPVALESLRAVVQSKQAELRARLSSLATLLDANDPQLVPVLHALVAEAGLRGPAIKGLARYADPNTPAVLLAAYPDLSAGERRDVLMTLASRRPYADALLDAIVSKKVAGNDVPAEIVRELRGFNDPVFRKRIADVWGLVRDTPAERKKAIEEMRHVANPSTPAPDLSHGRAIFAKTCQQCHTLYGVGAKVGPDITGSNRKDLNYLLENILDPSAIIQKEYTATRLTLHSGRALLGLVTGETPNAVTFVTADETLTIPISDIETRAPSDVSMMPDDLLKNLSATEIRALIAYLRHDGQVPLLATADNAKDFFNGKDLTGWDGDPKLWRVENGEIVGKSPGIAKNEFLKSQYVLSDFRLTVSVKLTPNKENSGIQFRSEVLPGGDVKGPQADIGAGWWGKLYEEHGRGLLWNRSGDDQVNKEDWNEYQIEAVGSRVRTWINGQLCVDLDDSKLARRGITALQIHSGGPMEVRFRDLRLELRPTGR